MEVSYPLPTVHLNGTGREMLSKGYSKAEHWVHVAIQSMAEIEFNARDYYVKGDGEFAKARAKRDEMLAKLREVREYLFAHMEAVG